MVTPQNISLVSRFLGIAKSIQNTRHKMVYVNTCIELLSSLQSCMSDISVICNLYTDL